MEFIEMNGGAGLKFRALFCPWTKKIKRVYTEGRRSKLSGNNYGVKIQVYFMNKMHMDLFMRLTIDIFIF